MSGKITETTERWPKRLAKFVGEQVSKTIIGVLVAGFMAWLAIQLGEYYDLIPCGLREWIWGVHCG